MVTPCFSWWFIDKYHELQTNNFELQTPRRDLFERSLSLAKEVY